MKIVTTVFAAAVLLAGCSSSSEEPAPEATSAAPTSGIPSPASDEVDPLVASLDLIAGGLADEAEDSVDNARNTCTSILGGSTGAQLLDATKTRFIGDGVDEMTDEQAQEIVDLVTAEPWCK